MKARPRERAQKWLPAGSFVLHRREMFESPAWRHLPDNPRRIVNRLELEHMRHGGTMNGRLGVTYSAFEQAGVRRGSIGLAIRQAVGLGFVEIMEVGHVAFARAGPHGVRIPSFYRLTHVFGLSPGKRGQPPTDEWAQVAGDDQARAILADLARDDAARKAARKARKATRDAEMLQRSA